MYDIFISSCITKIPNHPIRPSGSNGEISYAKGTVSIEDTKQSFFSVADLPCLYSFTSYSLILFHRTFNFCLTFL